jgi:hypothetical protein
MALRDVKARIATVLKGVAGIGQVYTYRRMLSAEKDRELLVASGRLHVWFVSRENTQLTDLGVNEGLVQQQDSMLIEGFMGVKDDDDTEEIFDGLVDSVLQAVNADRRPPNSGGTSLGGTIEVCSTPSVRKMEFATYGQSAALCHHVEITMKTTPRELQ